VDPPLSIKIEKVTQKILSETHGIKSFFSKAMIAAGIGIPENIFTVFSLLNATSRLF
jgi:hypothetical protein